MRCSYEALNSLDGSVVQHMLENEGIPAELVGAHLEGGAGELQAGNVVKVLVHEEDYPRARQIIEDWERRQPADDGAANETSPLPAFALGLLLGAGAMFLLLS